MRKFISIAAVLLAILAGLEYLLYRQVTAFTNVAKKPEASEPRDLLLSANDITFQSDDGGDLYGWLIQGKPGYPAVLIAHDYGSNRSLTLVKLEGLITALNKQGYFIFLFDFRGHGKSNSSSALGYLEANDMSAALKAVLRYKQIGRRAAVLGVGMGAIAAAQAFHKVDEVKVLLLDSLYADIPARHTDSIIKEWPFLTVSRYVLKPAVGLNFRVLLKTQSKLALHQQMADLYPKTVIFIEKEPLRKQAKDLYDVTREPKELLLLHQTATGELLGEDRQAYVSEVSGRVRKYLPPFNNEKQIELSR